MIKKIKRFFRKNFLQKLSYSYAQFGEDLIMHHLFYQLDIRHPSYLDIGANEPKAISNTYLFYERGSRGVLVEPNPVLYKKLKQQRPLDTCLNIGIGLKVEGEADFYVFPKNANGLSTFSESDAKYWGETGMKGRGKIPYEKVIKMPLVPVNTILEKYFAGKAPDFISLDVEGLDLEILQSMDFEKYRPILFCIETLMYDENQRTFKNEALINFMLSKDYFVYADTRVNTIFCRKDILI